MARRVVDEALANVEFQRVGRAMKGGLSGGPPTSNKPGKRPRAVGLDWTIVVGGNHSTRMSENRRLDGHRQIPMYRSGGGKIEGAFVALGGTTRGLPAGGPRGAQARAIAAEERRREEFPFEY